MYACVHMNHVRSYSLRYRHMIHTGQFQSGLATTYGKNRTEIEDTWPMGNETGFLPAAAGTFGNIREHSFLVCQFAFAFFQ